MDTESAARRWRETWLRSWPSKDVDAIAALYAPGARFRSQPFRDLQEPRAYADSAFSEQDEAEVWFGDPIVSGATVTADVVGGAKGPKVVSVKHRRRKGYHKKIGHRQKYTAVKITGING